MLLILPSVTSKDKMMIIYSCIKCTFDTWPHQMSHMVYGAWNNDFLILCSFGFIWVCGFCVFSCTRIVCALTCAQYQRGNIQAAAVSMSLTSDTSVLPEVSEITNPSKQYGHFLEGSCWEWGYLLHPRRCLHKWGSLGLHCELDCVALCTCNSSLAAGQRCTSSQSPVELSLPCASLLTAWCRGQW